MTTTLAPDAAGILAILGGQKRMRHRVRTLLDLANEVRAGLPKQALTSVLRAATRSPAEAVVARRRISADATWKRRTVYLRPDESDRTLRLARVVALARYVWDGREEDATEFLMATHPRLEGRTPLETCDTEIGATIVDDLLWQLFDGTVGLMPLVTRSASMTCVRVSDPRPPLMDGYGAARYPSRWNALIVPVVYSATSVAGALLEQLVHASIGRRPPLNRAQRPTP